MVCCASSILLYHHSFVSSAPVTPKFYRRALPSFFLTFAFLFIHFAPSFFTHLIYKPSTSLPHSPNVFPPFIFARHSTLFFPYTIDFTYISLFPRVFFFFTATLPLHAHFCTSHISPCYIIHCAVHQTYRLTCVPPDFSFPLSILLVLFTCSH